MTSFPECTVCKKPFHWKGPDPYLLPCFHAVCEPCLSSVQKEAHCVHCGFCQKGVDLKTTTEVQKDRVRQRLIFHLTGKHRPTELLCTHEDDGNQAVCWCPECEELYCEHCQNMHDSFKANKGHTVCGINEIGTSRDEEESHCSRHRKYVVELFDADCGVLICLKCKQGEHAGHRTLDIVTVAKSAREELHKNIQAVSEVKRKTQDCLSKGDQQLMRLKESETAQKEKINYTFDALKAVVDQRRKEILSCFDTNIEHAKRAISDRNALLTLHQNTASVVSDYTKIVLDHASTPELPGIAADIRDATKSCINSDLHKNAEIHSDVLFLPDDLPQVQTAVSTFSAISCDDFCFLTLCTAAVNKVTKLLSRLLKYKSKKAYVVYMESKIISPGDATVNHEQLNIELRQKCKTLEKEVVTLRAHIASLKANENVKDRKPSGAIALPETEDITQVSTFRFQDGETSFLDCVNVKFNAKILNTDKVHIDDEGALCNGPDNCSRIGERLRRYSGTCSVVPLLQVDCLQYWEALAQITLSQMIGMYESVLEIGLWRGEMRDDPMLRTQPGSHFIFVHRGYGNIDTTVKNEGRDVLTVPDVMPNKQTIPTTLHYGVVYDSSTRKIAFLDVKKRAVLAVLDNIDTSLPLWPVFGLCSQNRGLLKLKLVVGKDIYMSEEKIALIVQAMGQDARG